MPSTASSAVNTGDNILAAQYNNLRKDAQTFMLAVPIEVTISAGTITLTDNQAHYKIDTQSDAATDDLDTINGGSEGVIVMLKPEDAARAVTVKDSTGNILLGGGDHELDSADHSVILIRGPTDWMELGRSPRSSGQLESGIVLLAAAACPSGWSRFTTLDSRFPRGAASYSGSLIGVSTHTHVYTEIPSHTHGVGSLVTASDGAHTHQSYMYANAGGNNNVPSYEANTWQTRNTHAGGAHTHTISGATANTGDAAPTSSSATSIPPYLDMIFCQRD